MSDSAPQSADDAAAARAAEQARLRKERREAKIKAGGTSRLNKITGLGGGLQRDPVPVPSDEAAPASTSSKPSNQRPQQDEDPAEVDISQHYYQPQATPRPPPGSSPASHSIDEAQLRQMMLGFDRPAPGAGPGMPGMPDAEDVDDPMMRMMMQMMGGAGGPNGPNNPFGGANSPFGGANPFNMPPMGQAGQPQQTAIPDRYSAIWRLLHTFVALSLGLYIAVWTGFTGSKVQRNQGSLDGSSALDGDDETESRFQAKHFFWAFATAEAVLLTTRFFVDRTRAPPSGILWSIAGFLPAPFKGYLEVTLRYGQIFSTIKADVLVCIFVLGAASWAKGL